ncbi:MAG: flagellar export chaperone FliS [Gammaproteobacteria bacterium]|jgi:flagellar protein FliS|nr:flagellar export chaperone FliS [Gammaproteobacteria bacterium]
MSLTRNRQPLGHYSTVNAYGAAEAGSGPQLILTMMRTAQDRIAAGRGHLERGETAAKGEQLGKAIALLQGLRGALNHEAGAELAGNLDALYEYMTRRLLEGNARDEVVPLDEVSQLLAEIRGAWEQVVAQPGSNAGSAA